MGVFRSLLFAPATRPDRFDKASASGADTVCLDLEDAVPPGAKAQAREHALAYLRGRALGLRPAVGLRINSLRTLEGLRDLCALAESDAKPAFLMAPKVASAVELQMIADVLGVQRPPLWAIVESAEGLFKAQEIAAAASVEGLLFGGVDYAADLGCELAWEPLAHARGVLATAAAAAGVQLLDAPHTDVADLTALEVETRRARALGFTGRACIHPAQVAVVNAAFTPDGVEVARAQAVVSAFEAAAGGAALFEGRLIELPVVRSARRVLERAGAA